MTRRYGEVSFGGRSNGPSALSAGKPAAQFPAAVVNDQHLAIAADRIQTSLAASMGTADVTMTVQSAAGIVANMLLSIDSEIVQAAGTPTGTMVPVLRGFDGTAPAVHSSNAVVSGYVDAYHHNTLVAEIEAIEQALGPNLSGIPGNPGYIVTTPYDFPPQTPGVALGTGAQTFTMAPVPRGVNGGNTGAMLYLSGGTGAAEAVPIIGGNAVAGQPSGTVIVTTAYAHSGAWTVQSASNGIQEAIVDAGTGKLVFIPAGAYAIKGQIVMPYNAQSIQGAGRDETVLTLANGANQGSVFLIGAHQNITIERMGFEGNFVNQNHAPGVLNTCINGQYSLWLRVRNCRFHGFGYTLAADAGNTQVISLYNCFNSEVSDCLFLSNLAYEINAAAVSGVLIVNNQFGSPNIQDAQTPTNWWDSYAGGFGTICIGSNDVFFSGNRMFGSSRSSTLSAFGYLISSGGGMVQMSNVKIQNNEFHGLGNSRGTVSVTSGSGAVIGLNTTFVNGDVTRKFQVEGDQNIYTVTAYTSATQITVSPVIAHATGSNLRYFYQNSGDAISVDPVNDLQITGNAVYDSGDMSYDLGGLAGSSTQHLIFANNIASRSQVAGLFIGGPVFDAVITGNLFVDCNRKGLAGHQGAIEISPTNQGATTPQSMWHMTFSNNQFLDDQVAATQLYGFMIEVGQESHVFDCSFIGNTYWAYSGGGGLFNPEVTTSQMGVMFSRIPTINASTEYLPITFSSLPNINNGAPVKGTMVYCFDAKSIADGALAGSVAVGGGTGTVLVYLNGSWKVGF